MCGFTGLLDPRHGLSADAARARLRAMAYAIHHRGPDAEGIVIEETAGGAAWAGLGHRRLSVLDLSAAGAQPMVSRCGRYMIAYNGEIYNYRDLRAELEARSARGWRGHSDTEVLLEGIARDGVAATLARLDGMFAFALIDRETRTLTLARDAFGEKPLVYGIWGGVLLFGSDLRALRAWPGFAPEEDPQARAALMQYGYIPAPATIHMGICKLAPAHMIEICPEAVLAGTLPAPVPWWDMAGEALAARQDPFEGDFEAAVDAVETTFARSVARRMVSDVPLGALLSGGEMRGERCERARERERCALLSGRTSRGQPQEFFAGRQTKRRINCVLICQRRHVRAPPVLGPRSSQYKTGPKAACIRRLNSWQVYWSRIDRWMSRPSTRCFKMSISRLS